MFHYTNEKGHKAISSQQTWLFKASKPPGDHPKGAYFTTLPPWTKNLAKRLFVRGCADKATFMFCFSGGEDLIASAGGRGAFIFYSETDYRWRRSDKDPIARRRRYRRRSDDRGLRHRDPGSRRPRCPRGCRRVIQRYWPHARFEDAETGDKYSCYGEIPFGRVRELLAYPDADAEAAWDSDSPDSPPNSMLYLIRSLESVTVVLDDPRTAEMRSILESVRTMLWQDILNAYARAA